MWKFIHSLIPDEWVSAYKAYAEMARVLFGTPRGIAKFCVSVFLPFTAGVAIFFFIKSRLTPDFMQAYLVVLGVLFGFVSTIMLFIGSTEGTDILDHNQALKYGEKIRYLLASQALTLVWYLIAIVLGAWWLYSKDGGSFATAYIYVEPFVFGSGGVAIIRTILLAGQIYDRHDFVMTELVEKKKREHQERIKQMQHEVEQA